MATLLRTPEGENARAAAHVAVDTLLRVAAADAAAADQRTGRNVATAHETVAADLGMSAKTVQRARTLLERLGMAVTVWAGRYLTAAERAAARRRHGTTQLRAASTRALVSPKYAVRLVPVENVQLPRRGQPTKSSHPSENSPTRSRARRKPASVSPPPIGVQKLAAQLARRMPWLARGRHIGSLARLLQRHQLTVDAGWNAEKVLGVLEQHNRESGRLVPDPAQQRNPLGYLSWLLTAAAAGFAGASQVRPAGPAAPSWREEDAVRQRQLKAEDPAIRLEIIAQIRADIAVEQHGAGSRFTGSKSNPAAARLGRQHASSRPHGTFSSLDIRTTA